MVEAANSYGVSFGGDEKCSGISGDSQSCEYTKNHTVVYFKRMNYSSIYKKRKKKKEKRVTLRST